MLGVPEQQARADLRQELPVLPVRSRLMPTGRRWWYGVRQDMVGWWDAVLASARESAEAEGAVLRSETPVFGWMAQNRRDRKWYPCRDSARGAVPAWIWYGDMPNR